MRFDDPLYADFYNKRQIKAGYPGKLLDLVLDNISGCTTILDIGAGTGFFAAPIAEKGIRVTAIEPSREMTAIMKERYSSEVMKLIEIVNTPWEKWQGPRADGAICVHSLYPMKEPLIAVEKMINSAEVRIVIVRDSENMTTLSGLVRKKLGIDKDRDLNKPLKELLKNKGINYKIINTRETRLTVITDPLKEAESLRYQLKLEKKYSEAILDVIKKNCSRENEGITFTALYSDNAWIF